MNWHVKGTKKKQKEHKEHRGGERGRERERVRDHRCQWYAGDKAHISACLRSENCCCILSDCLVRNRAVTLIEAVSQHPSRRQCSLYSPLIKKKTKKLMKLACTVCNFAPRKKKQFSNTVCLCVTFAGLPRRAKKKQGVSDAFRHSYLNRGPVTVSGDQIQVSS